jgi:hypothetical protein
LFLAAGSGLIHKLVAGLCRLLKAGFLILENLLAGLAEALFIFGSAGCSGGYVGARLFHGPLGAAAALS